MSNSPDSALDEYRRVLSRLRGLRERFGEVHAAATAAIQVGGFSRLIEIARVERGIFEEQAQLIDALRQFSDPTS